MQPSGLLEKSSDWLPPAAAAVHSSCLFSVSPTCGASSREPIGYRFCLDSVSPPRLTSIALAVPALFHIPMDMC